MRDEGMRDEFVWRKKLVLVRKKKAQQHNEYFWEKRYVVGKRFCILLWLKEVLQAFTISPFVNIFHCTLCRPTQDNNHPHQKHPRLYSQVLLGSFGDATTTWEVFKVLLSMKTRRDYWCVPFAFVFSVIPSTAEMVIHSVAIAYKQRWI